MNILLVRTSIGKYQTGDKRNNQTNVQNKQTNKTTNINTSVQKSQNIVRSLLNHAFYSVKLENSAVAVVGEKFSRGIFNNSGGGKVLSILRTLF